MITFKNKNSIIVLILLYPVEKDMHKHILKLLAQKVVAQRFGIKTTPTVPNKSQATAKEKVFFLEKTKTKKSQRGEGEYLFIKKK